MSVHFRPHSYRHDAYLASLGTMLICDVRHIGPRHHADAGGYDGLMLQTMPTFTETERAEAAARRARLLAALGHTGISQAELVRRLNLAGERTATTTVNRWCVGKVSISEAMLRYVLTTMGLPADWQPPRPDDA